MSSSFWLSRTISIICLILVTALFAFADTIRLKDGSIIKGKIVGFSAGSFTIVIDDGTRQRTLTYRADEVESILFDSGSATNNSGDKSPKTVTDGKNTVITVGGNRPEPIVPARKEDTSANTPPKIVSSDKTAPKTVVTTTPITIRIPVMADNTSNGWTNSGWVVRKGQKIRIIGSGRVALGNGRYASPGGVSTLPDTDKLMKSHPTGALIAVIGSDNNEFIFIGDSFEFTATRDGDLFLGINEGNLNDNSGSFEVTIEIDPNTE